MVIIQMMFTDEDKKIPAEKGGARKLRKYCEHSFRPGLKVTGVLSQTDAHSPENDI